MRDMEPKTFRSQEYVDAMRNLTDALYKAIYYAHTAESDSLRRYYDYMEAGDDREKDAQQDHVAAYNARVALVHANIEIERILKGIAKKDESYDSIRAEADRTIFKEAA